MELLFWLSNFGWNSLLGIEEVIPKLLSYENYDFCFWNFMNEKLLFFFVVSDFQQTLFWRKNHKIALITFDKGEIFARKTFTVSVISYNVVDHLNCSLLTIRTQMLFVITSNSQKKISNWSTIKIKVIQNQMK
jgi:hypothetical protein